MAIHYNIIDEHTPALNYFDTLMALTAEVQQRQAAPYLYPPDAAFFKRTLDTSYVKVFALDGDKVVGFAVLAYLQQWPDYVSHLAYDCQSSAVVYFTLVHPDYRGQGINKQMTKLRIDAATTAGKKYLFSTVHPDNKPSMKTLTGFGMTVLEQRTMFEEQMLRNLMFMAVGDL